MKFIAGLVALFAFWVNGARAEGATAFNMCGLFDGKYYGDVFFQPTGIGATASAREMVPKLVVLADALKSHQCCPGVFWVLNAHADKYEVPPAAYDNLAQNRAEYVQGLLVGLGVPKNRICTFARGASQPVANPPSTKNARVEIDVLCAFHDRGIKQSVCEGL